MILLHFPAARDRLSDLTSREGDWFLDELCTMSGNVSQMTTTLEFCFTVSIITNMSKCATGIKLINIKRNI